MQTIAHRFSIKDIGLFFLFLECGSYPNLAWYSALLKVIHYRYSNLHSYDKS